MKEEPKYYLTDIESGIRYEVSKDHYDKYHKMLEYIENLFKDKSPINVGKIMIFGTGGELDTGKFEDIWNKNDTFNRIK